MYYILFKLFFNRWYLIESNSKFKEISPIFSKFSKRMSIFNNLMMTIDKRKRYKNVTG